MFCPRFSSVFAEKKSAVFFGSFNNCVNVIGIYRRNCQTDASDIAGRQAVREFAPRFSGIFRFVNCRFGSAVNERKNMSSALITCTIEHIRISRVEHNIRNAGLRADVQNFLPSCAFVDGFIQTTLAAVAPERTLRGNINVRISRVNNDAPDVFGLL